jgi:hypothetical protein
MSRSRKSREVITPYHKQVWKYLVYELRYGNFQLAADGQTDCDRQAFQMAAESTCPAYVKDVLRDEVIYRNY